MSFNKSIFYLQQSIPRPIGDAGRRDPGRSQRHSENISGMIRGAEIDTCTQKCKFMSKEVRENRAFFVAPPRVFPLSVRASFTRDIQIITQNSTPLSTTWVGYSRPQCIRITADNNQKVVTPQINQSDHRTLSVFIPYA